MGAMLETPQHLRKMLRNPAPRWAVVFGVVVLLVLAAVTVVVDTFYYRDSFRIIMIGCGCVLGLAVLMLVFLEIAYRLIKPTGRQTRRR